jgi:hypothetical protein
MLVDDLMPVYDVSDSVAAIVHADLATTWEALMDVDLIEVGRRRPLVAALGALRALPEMVSHLFHGEFRASSPTLLRLRDLAAVPMREGGWILLGEHTRHEIALGLIGKFWHPVIEFADIAPGQFGGFAEPGFAKTIYSLSVRRVDAAHTLVTGTMRTAGTDEQARRWFRRYWTLGVGSGAHVLVNGLIDTVRELAETRAEAATHAHQR